MMKSRMQKILLTIFILSAGCSGKDRSGMDSGGEPLKGQGSLIPADALTVSYGRLVETVEASGLLRGASEAFVVSETQGIIQEVFFDLGSSVGRKDILLKVDDTIPRLNMEQASVQLENAKLELNALTRLRESGSASQLQYNQAQSAVRGAEASYRNAVKIYENCTVRAPIEGLIASKENSVTVGNLLTPGTVIAGITDLRKLRMIVSLGEGEVGLIAAGMPAVMSVPVCGSLMEGTVSAIAAGSDPLTGAFQAAVEWENTCGEKIRAGMSATAVIRTVDEAVKLIVPQQAVTARGGESYLFTADSVSVGGSVKTTESRVSLKKVVPGRTIGGRTEILSGISEGDVVIISAVNRLSDGMKVLVTITGNTGEWR